MGILIRSSILAAAITGVCATASPAQTPTPDEAAFRALYRQRIEINTAVFSTKS